MAAIKVADLFAKVGMRFDPRALNQLQRRLDHVKRQFLSLQRVASLSLAQTGSLAQVRALNIELTRTAGLMSTIAASGPIRVSGMGAGGAAAAAGGGGRRGRGFNTGGGMAFGGMVSGAGAGRVPVFARNFFAGFTGAIAIRQLFQAQASIDAVRASLMATLRPGETLGETMSFMRQEAERLGFEFSSASLQFSKLAAAGKAAGITTEETRDIFIAAQEASRVFSLSVEETRGVLKAFEQILSKGKVTAEELRNQLGDRLPAAVPMFAKAIGVTTRELNDMLEQGEVMANETLPKFAKQMRKEFAGSVEAASQTAQSNLNRFLNAWFEFRVAVVESGLGDAFNLILLGAAELMKTMLPVIKVVSKGIRFLITPIHALFRILDALEKAIPGINSKLMSLGLTLGGLILILKKFTIAQLAAFSGFVAAGLAIAGIIILIDDLATALRGGESAIGSLTESANPFIASLAQIFLFLGGIVKFASEFIAFLATGADSFNTLADSAREFRDIIVDTVEKLGELANALSFGVLGRAGANLGGAVSSAAEFSRDPSSFMPGWATWSLSDLGRGNGQGGGVVLQGGDIHVNAPAGTADDIARAVGDEVSKQNEAMRREAQGEFGDQE